MILIITTLIIIIFMSISIYYINNIQKKAESITTKKIEHMVDINNVDNSNLHLILSNNYKQQFLQDGIKNINKTKIIENGVIKFKDPPKTEYELTRDKMDNSSLDSFFNKISESLLPYTPSQQEGNSNTTQSSMLGSNVDSIPLQNLEKFFQLVLKAKHKLHTYKQNAIKTGHLSSVGHDTQLPLSTPTSSGTTPPSSGTTPPSSGTTPTNQVSIPTTTKNISLDIEKDIKAKELEIQKMIDDVLKNINKDRGGIVPTIDNHDDYNKYVGIDKNKLMDYLKSMYTDGENTLINPFEYKSKDDKDEDWKIENNKEFEYIDDPSYPDDKDEEYYKRNTEEYNREQQDYYDTISLLNDIELYKQKWLYNNNCKKLLEEPYLHNFKKAYHNYMIYAFTNVLKYLPAIEKPTELTVIELKAYKQILQKMPNCEDLMSMFDDNIIDSLNCNNKKKEKDEKKKKKTDTKSKMFKLSLDKNMVGSKKNSNSSTTKSSGKNSNSKITTSTTIQSTTTNPTTTNPTTSNPKTSKSKTSKPVSSHTNNLIGNKVSLDDPFNFDMKLNQVESDDFQPFDPLNGQCPVMHTLQDMKSLKILK